MEQFFTGYRRIAILVCLGVLVLACAQGPDDQDPPPQTRNRTTKPTPTIYLSPTSEPTVAPTAAPTDTPVPQSQVKRSANMRQGPGTSYPVVRTVNANATVELLAVREEKGQRWYRVRADGVEGWMSATVLSVDDAVAAAVPVDIQTLAPLPTATPKPVAVAKPTATPKPVVVIEPTVKSAPTIVVQSSGVRVGAICRDGSRSSATGRGACSHHGGVDHWLVQ